MLMLMGSGSSSPQLRSQRAYSREDTINPHQWIQVSASQCNTAAGQSDNLRKDV